MSKELPHDLAKIHDWCMATIEAIWGLRWADTDREMRAARACLLKQIDRYPKIDASLERELVVASDRWRCIDPAAVEDVPAKHALEVVYKKGVLALSIVQARSHACLSQALQHWDMTGSYPSNIADLVQALNLDRELRKGPDRVVCHKFRAILDRSFKAFPENLSTEADDEPLQIDIPCPGGALAAWVERVLYGVWHERAATSEATLKSPGGPEADPGTQTRKRPPGRRQAYEPAEAEKIATRWAECRLQYRTYEHFAKEVYPDLSGPYIKRAVDRHRHRNSRRK